MNMNGKIRPLLWALTITVLLTGGAYAENACKDAPLDDRDAFATACTETAVNEPYKFAWLLLGKICDLDSEQDPKNPQPCEWESWATNKQTFPEHPTKDTPPEWPVDAAAEEFSCEEGAVLKGILERRRNRAGFKYIIENKLWYQDRLVKMYKDNSKIEFPQNAVDVAVSWKEIEEGERDDYHWKRLSSGKFCGMTTLDVKSKILPNWFFFAFEHVDNPGRCDFTGCRDDFGQTPPFISPIFKLSTPRYNPKELDKRPTYAPGVLTEKLENLIGLNELWKKNYRLKGVQTELVTADGKPTILAGSQIEGLFFPASSSCMTCHTRAGFNWKGQSLYEAEDFGTLETSPNGAPDPKWFYGMGPHGWQLHYQQSDLVWAIPKNARPLQKPMND